MCVQVQAAVMAVCARCVGSTVGYSVPSGISSSPLSAEAMIAVWLAESRFKLGLKSRCCERVVGKKVGLCGALSSPRETAT